MFSSITYAELSIITEEKPASIAALQLSKEEPWSKCNATGTVMFIVSIKASTIADTTLTPPMYFPAPSETPKITGDFSASAASNTDCVHSRLLMLN